MKEFVIREMFDSDLDSVLKIESEGHLHPWGRGVFRDCLKVSYSCRVMLDSVDEIVGYGVMSIAAGEAHIFNVCVDKTKRRQGLGIIMMQHLLQVAKYKNTGSIFLEVRPSNISAIKLYKKLGFNQVGIRKNYYPNKNAREDAVIMALELEKNIGSS